MTPKRPNGLLSFRRDDGGRAAAGFKGEAAGDCVTRAIAIATGKPYAEVYAALNALAKTERPGARARKQKGKRSSARTGVFKPTIRRYMESIGWQWVPCMQIGSGCKVHLRADELPPGRLVVSVSRHCVAVVDGVLHDTEDCTRDGSRCVYGFYMRKGLTVTAASGAVFGTEDATRLESASTRALSREIVRAMPSVYRPGWKIGEQPTRSPAEHFDGVAVEMFAKPTPFDDALAKVRADLEWRGPTTGAKQGHVVLTRAQAAALIGYEDGE